MALNPFFLQGSASEQRLVQDLINEQLTIYGVEVTYIPRKYVRKATVLKEVTSSKFDDNFLLEAYVDTYEGYSGQGDIMTKFGVSLKDELTVTVSKERFEDFISPFLEADEDYELASRPREGDIIFFPLGERLFEVKFVEHEEPFYQLGKNYVYQLKCELFEYEDEILDTDIEAIDTQLEDLGFITTLNLIGTGATATVATNGDGVVSSVSLTSNTGGEGYAVGDQLGITTKTRWSLGYPKENKGQERLIDICKSEKADMYINAISGKELYNPDDFYLEGIELRFIKRADNENDLSIIDILMRRGWEETSELVKQYELVE